MNHLSQRFQSPGPRPEPAPASVSHLVFSQPGESFLAIETSPGRFPVANIRFVDEVIAWRRFDGVPELLDLRGSESLQSLQSAFESDDGLMVLSYPSLSTIATDFGPADVTFLTSRPASSASSRHAEVSRA